MKRLLPAVVFFSNACRTPSAPPPHEVSALTVVAPPAALSVEAQPDSSVSATAEGSPPAPEPPYDLDADIAARKVKLTAELGPDTKFVVVERVFLLASPTGLWIGAPPLAKEALGAYFNGRFKTRPARAISVVVFATAPTYEAYCKEKLGAPCGTPFGFYRADLRALIMNIGPGVGTLTHEIVHPIVEADFPKAPDWINEGIASLYEAFSMPAKGEISGQRNFRLPALRKALKSDADRAKVNLPALFAMSDATFRGDDESLNYAAARYFCMWMEGQKKLWPFYQAWRDGYADDPTGEKAFLATMGKTPDELDAAWAKWVLTL